MSVSNLNYKQFQNLFHSENPQSLNIFQLKTKYNRSDLTSILDISCLFLLFKVVGHSRLVNDTIEYGVTSGLFSNLTFSSLSLSPSASSNTTDNSTTENTTTQSNATEILLQNVTCILQNSTNISITVFNLSSEGQILNSSEGFTFANGIGLQLSNVNIQCDGFLDDSILGGGGESSNDTNNSTNQTDTNSTNLTPWRITVENLTVTINVTLDTNNTAYYTIVPQISYINSSSVAQNLTIFLASNSTPENQTFEALPTNNETNQLLVGAINERLNATLNRQAGSINAYISENLTQLTVDDYIVYYMSVQNDSFFVFQQSNSSEDGGQVNQTFFQFFIEVGGFFNDNRSISLSDAANSGNYASVDPYLILPQDQQNQTQSQNASTTIPNDFKAFTNTQDKSSDLNVWIENKWVRSFIYRELMTINYLTPEVIQEKIIVGEDVKLNQIQINIRDPQQLWNGRHTNETNMRITLNNYQLLLNGDVRYRDTDYRFNLTCDLDDDRNSEFIVNFYSGLCNYQLYCPQIAVESINLNLDNDQCELVISETSGETTFLTNLVENFIEIFRLQGYIDRIQNQINQQAPRAVNDRINDKIKQYWRPIELFRDELYLYLNMTSNPTVSVDGSVILPIDLYTQVNSTEPAQ
eukprot:403361234